MIISNKPENEWDENTRALNDLYNGPISNIIPGSSGSTIVYNGIPSSDIDVDDTAGIGVKVSIGALIQDSNTGTLYRCSDNTSGSAVWTIIVQERI